MAQSLEIRSPTDDEISAMLYLRYEMLDKPSDVQEATELSRDDTQDSTVLLVAVRQDASGQKEVVGTLRLVRHDLPRTDIYALECVATKYHREGIGTLLVAEALLSAERIGAKCLKLTAISDEVVPFYQQAGFWVTDDNSDINCGPSMAMNIKSSTERSTL